MAIALSRKVLAPLERLPPAGNADNMQDAVGLVMAAVPASLLV